MFLCTPPLYLYSPPRSVSPDAVRFPAVPPDPSRGDHQPQAAVDMASVAPVWAWAARLVQSTVSAHPHHTGRGSGARKRCPVGSGVSSGQIWRELQQVRANLAASLRGSATPAHALKPSHQIRRRILQAVPGEGVLWAQRAQTSASYGVIGDVNRCGVKMPTVVRKRSWRTARPLRVNPSIDHSSVRPEAGPHPNHHPPPPVYCLTIRVMLYP